MDHDNYLYVDTYKGWKIFFNQDADKYIAQHLHGEIDAKTYRGILDQIDSTGTKSLFSFNRLNISMPKIRSKTRL
jgi:hypothetical protein